MKRPFILAALVLASAPATVCWAQDVAPPLVGTDEHSTAYHQPDDWPAAAGAWNGKAARYNAATRQLMFETYRRDIVGGSIAIGRGAIPGVRRYYQAGPNSGSEEASGSTVLYVAGADGSQPRCIGCTDVVEAATGCGFSRRSQAPRIAPTSR